MGSAPANSTTSKDGAKGTRRGGRDAVRLGEKELRPVKPTAKAGKSGKQANNKRGKDVRKRIIAAALECFGAFGFEGTSTRAVAERANVTHTLILYHFKSKEKLWLATMDEFLSAYEDEMMKHIAEARKESAAAAVRTFVERFIRMSARRPEIHRILTMESNQGTSRLNWVIENYLRKHFEAITTVIRQAQQDGTVRQCDPARLYYMIISTCGTPFTISTEYKELTGRDVFAETEILRNIAFLYELIFID
ncbi:MAG: TetR/AcrR family transcriptional regulator [Novosphingobium sp.]